MKRNKEMFEEENGNYENNNQLDEELLNEDEIDEDIFMLEDAYADDGTFSSLTEVDSYEGDESRKGRLNKPSSNLRRKSRQSETDTALVKDKAAAAAILEKQLCKDIDQKLSLISAIDSALHVISASSQLAAKDSLDPNIWTTTELMSETELEVKMSLDDMVDKVVSFYESIYDEMPNIALGGFSNMPIIHKSESFKVTLGSLNLPKVRYRKTYVNT